jgi:hypothetical protein
MFDLNQILSAALNAAVAEAIRPLLERITALEERITGIVAQPAAQIDWHIDEAKMVEALNSQEWFWEKLRRTTDAQIEQAMDDHCSTYDHDEYDSVVSNWNDEDPADFLREGDLHDQIDDRVNETLRNATFSISI